VRILRGDSSISLDAAQPGFEDIGGLVASWESSGMTLEHNIVIDSADLTPAAHASLYRVLQEALTNAARHGTGSVSIVLEPEQDHVHLVVTNSLSTERDPAGEGAGIGGMR